MNYINLKDAQLLSLIKQDDHTAFRELYRRYWKGCYVQVLQKSANNKELAEELTQHVFVSLWERRAVQTIQNLPTYLNSAIRFSFINHVKRLLRFEDYRYYSKDHFSEKSDSLVREIAFKDLSRAIEKGVALLPVKTKEVFRLSRIESWPIKDIAKQLKISEKAVEYDITQSLKTMRIALKEYLIFTLIPIFVFFLAS